METLRQQALPGAYAPRHVADMLPAWAGPVRSTEMAGNEKTWRASIKNGHACLMRYQEQKAGERAQACLVPGARFNK